MLCSTPQSSTPQRNHAADDRILEVQLSNIHFAKAGKSCYGGIDPFNSSDKNNMCVYADDGAMSFAFSSASLADENAPHGDSSVTEWDPRLDWDGLDQSGAPFAIGNDYNLKWGGAPRACWKLLEVHSFALAEGDSDSNPNSNQRGDTISLIFGTRHFQNEACKDVRNFTINAALSGRSKVP